MSSLVVILALCTVVAVGIVYFFTNQLLLAMIVLVLGLVLAFFFDQRWRLEEAKRQVGEAESDGKLQIWRDLGRLRESQTLISNQTQGVMFKAVDNIYMVAYHILRDEKIDPKFVYQVGLYIPRINQIVDAYLLKGAELGFKQQSEAFMEQTSEVFTRLLTASGNQDMKEAEALMQALNETYRSHGHLKGDEGGDLL